MVADDNRYNQTLHATIQTSFTAGEEVHILTQDTRDERIMNIRVNRVAPSRNGHVGYTKKGFYLTEEEAIEEIITDSPEISKGSAWPVILIFLALLG